MEHWEFLLAAFAMGCIARRWWGMGETGPRWIKIGYIAMCMLILMHPFILLHGWAYYLVAVVFGVLFWIPGHHFADKGDLDDLAYRYLLPPMVVGAGYWICDIPGSWIMLIAGPAVWFWWASMNIIYNYFPKISRKLVSGRVFDGPYSYAEALSGGTFFAFMAQWASMQ